MKKYISVIVSLALVLGIIFSLTVPMSAIAKDDGNTVLYADKVKTAPDLNDPSTWGTPVVFTTKTENVSTHEHNSSIDVETASLYLLWDSKKLYFGMSSPETDVRGSANNSSWEGDGIQLHIEKGDSLTGDRKDYYVTFEENKTGKHGSYNNYDVSLFVKDNVMYTMIAMPHADFGFESSEIAPGARYTFDALRIIGTSLHPYAGWLSIGAFFGMNNEYNPNATGDCKIVLRDPDKPGAEFNAPSTKASKLKDIKKGSGFSAAGEALKAVDNVAVQTKDGVFIVYTTKIGVMQEKKGNAYNSFSLQKINEEGEGEELAYAYTQSGSQSLYADEDGVLYIVGGGSSWDIKRLSSTYDYKAFKEKAYLNYWVYKDDFLNGVSRQIEFTNPSADGYELLYATYSDKKFNWAYGGETADGKYAMEFFEYDLTTKEWKSILVEVIAKAPASEELSIEYLFDFADNIYWIELIKDQPATAVFETTDGVAFQTAKLDSKVKPGKTVFCFQTKEDTVLIIFDGYDGSGKFSWYSTEVKLTVPSVQK